MFVGREVRLETGRIRLPKIGWLQVRGLALPAGADIRQVAVMQEPSGWHVSIQFEAVPKVYAEPALPLVSIDGGLAHLAKLSDGTRIAHPRLARKAAKRIRRLNRQRDRRRRGSISRRRTVARLGRMLGDAREDAIHKATRTLADTYAGFAVKGLSLLGLMRTRMAGSLADAGLGGVLRTLHHKAEWAGRTWHVHGRFARSTGVCPVCNQARSKLPLSVRSWIYVGCGAVHSRDVAAAQVILAGTIGQGRPEPAAAMPRKRGDAVRGGAGAQAPARHGESPANARAAREQKQ